MNMTRTEYRRERRTLLKAILNKLFIIQSFNDTDLEKIKRQFFINLIMDLDDIIKRVSYGERENVGNRAFISKKESKDGEKSD